jgi:hypothetical protein
VLGPEFADHPAQVEQLSGHNDYPLSEALRAAAKFNFVTSLLIKAAIIMLWITETCMNTEDALFPIFLIMLVLLVLVGFWVWLVAVLTRFDSQDPLCYSVSRYEALLEEAARDVLARARNAGAGTAAAALAGYGSYGSSMAGIGSYGSYGSTAAYYYGNGTNLRGNATHAVAGIGLGALLWKTIKVAFWSILLELMICRSGDLFVVKGKRTGQKMRQIARGSTGWWLHLKNRYFLP